MIRKAEFRDIPGMLALAKRGHAKSEYARLEFDEAGARLLGAQCISGKSLCAFVAESDGQIVGLLLGSEESFGYLKARFATDLAFYCEHPGKGMRLMKRFLKWALEERKVDQVLLNVSFGGKSAEAAPSLYKRIGFRHVGGMFVMDRGEAK